ncbi:hypothetical protein H0H81_001492 [Sphagnurus paluster]|uniref:Uncharacterized protein n=1 Tax=Sphagnurus paluster TaxID=117069 RepID=A0A9P7K356_9AGAR|nr:hypothetical protein H0H81_001492 [Sphagnurus paluster]
MPPPADSAKLALIDPHHAHAVVNPKPPFLGGYPLPGPQSLSGTAAMNKTAFVDDNTWRILAEHGHFDDIVVGSGFCALAYITTALERDPDRKILLLERGGKY